MKKIFGIQPAFSVSLRVAASLLLSLAAALMAFSPVRQDPRDKAALGERLFFDPILSLDSSISCASCHKPAFAFADTVAFSAGVGGKTGTRNTPSAMNQSDRAYYFYDGRVGSLEAQALHPIRNPVEMNLPVAEAVRRLRRHPEYSRWFEALYGQPVDSVLLGHAISEYERTLETYDSAHDRWLMNDDTTAVTAAQMRGREIFLVRGKCFECHFSPDFTGDEFRNIGLYNGRELNDTGRFAITGDPADLGKFKVPGLRNVAVTAPYMHNGMFKTLREVIDYYDDPGKFVKGSINTDTLLLQPLRLTEQEKQDLESYLRALTDRRFERGR